MEPPAGPLVGRHPRDVEEPGTVSSGGGHVGGRFRRPRAGDDGVLLGERMREIVVEKVFVFSVPGIGLSGASCAGRPVIAPTLSCRLPDLRATPKRLKLGSHAQ